MWQNGGVAAAISYFWGEPMAGCAVPLRRPAWPPQRPRAQPCRRARSCNGRTVSWAICPASWSKVLLEVMAPFTAST